MKKFIICVLLVTFTIIGAAFAGGCKDNPSSSSSSSSSSKSGIDLPVIPLD